MKERVVDTLFEGTMDRVCKGRDKGIIDRVDDGYANMWVAPHDRQGLNERTVDGLDVRAFKVNGINDGAVDNFKQDDGRFDLDPYSSNPSHVCIKASVKQLMKDLQLIQEWKYADEGNVADIRPSNAFFHSFSSSSRSRR